MHDLKVALIKQDWATVMRLADSVLEDPNHAADSELLFKISRAAHAMGDRQRSAELLIDANRAEGFQSEIRVRQAVVAMVEIGQLEQTFAWLEEVVDKQPDQHSTRRWLFDLYRSVDRSVDARLHGAYLIRNRQFDVKLLQSMIRTAPPVKDVSAIKAMVDRNPADQRPLLRMAEIAFRNDDFAETIRVCERILTAHPNYAPAQVLKALCFAKTLRLDQAGAFLDEISSEDAKRYPRYWLANGMVAAGGKDPKQAFDAFQRALVLDVNNVQAWQGLISVVAQSVEIEASVLKQMEQRVEQLESLSSHEDLFNRTGKISREVAVQIAQDLSKLGRVWEAEAWASIALSLPPDDSVDAESVRQRMVGALSNDSPFQVIKGHPELEFIRS